MKKLGILCMLCCVFFLAGCVSREAKEGYEKGAGALEQKNYETAAQDFQAVIDMEEKLPEAYRGLGVAQYHRGKYAEASIALSKCLVSMEKENPEFEKDVKGYLALSRSKRGEYEEAIEVYGDLLVLEENPDYYYLRGKCYLALENQEAARADFDRAAKKSRDYNLFVNIYESYDALQMNADGSAYLEQALELVGDTDYYSRGLIHFYLQDYTSAKDNLIQAINQKDDSKAILLLGKVYLSMGDVANARAMYQEYTKDEDYAAKAYNGLALCDIAEESYDSALINIQKGLEYEDEEVEQSLLFNEICVYEYLKDWDNARAKTAEYITRYPTDEEAIRENEFLTH